MNFTKKDIDEPQAPPWSSRFEKKPHPVAKRIGASVSFDKRLAEVDIRGSMAHARMLARAGVLSKKELASILKGLKDIAAEIEAGKFRFKDDLEDVHMNIEAALTEKIGQAGMKLHSGRSRNDQVALDLRLYLRDEIDKLLGLAASLRKAIAGLGLANIDVIIAGYTHTRRAQPVLFAEHIGAYAEMLIRDEERLKEVRARVNISPLGAAAFAGSSLPLDPKSLAKELGFEGIFANSVDAVSDRDFAIEFVSAASICMMHLSRLCEELIYWAGEEYDLIKIPEQFCTGSSIMPNKRNPDVLELVRGKSGRVYGSLVSLLTMMKGLPLAYNRDFQEDKEQVFDAADTLMICLEALSALVPGIEVNRERAAENASDGSLLATDLAEYLVLKGVPFRKAHNIVAKLIKDCEKKGKALTDLSLAELQNYSDRLDKAAMKILNAKASVKRKLTHGGTNPAGVKRRLKALLK